jgi:SPP1 gp7 family putative phage head morphogenesis protein
MWKVTSDPLRFDEAVEWFRERVPLSNEAFQALTADARRRAVTVSGIVELDLIDQVYSAIDKAIEEGTDFRQFQAELGAKLEAAWGDSVANPAWRLENLFRTNVQTAYSAGRWKQQTDPEVIAARSFWLYDAVLDNRTSTICRNLDGTLLPADHPRWQEIYPPNHFGGCRSGVRSLTRRQAEERGGATAVPTQSPDVAFRHAPSLDDWEPDLSEYPAELRQAYERKRGTE